MLLTGLIQASAVVVLLEMQHQVLLNVLQKKWMGWTTKEPSLEIMKTAKAEADAVTVKAGAEKEKLKAEAEGRAAVIKAENSLSMEQIEMQIELHRLNKLPEIATQMMKPVEKIDSIRINQIGGLGGASNVADGADGAFGAAMDQILGMAVRLPVMKQMGEEIGLDFDANLAGRTADYANRIKAKDDPKPNDKE